MICVLCKDATTDGYSLPGGHKGLKVGWYCARCFERVIAREVRRDADQTEQTACLQGWKTTFSPKTHNGQNMYGAHEGYYAGVYHQKRKAPVLDEVERLL